MSAKTRLKSLLKRSSRKVVTFGLFGLGSVTIASPAFAASIDLSNFQTSGDVGNVTPDQATITNAVSSSNPQYPDDFDGSGNPVNYNVSGSEPTYISDLETFLGVSQGALGLDATEGSAIRTANPISFLAGDTFSFDFDFVTNDDPGSDFAFVTIGSSILSATGSRFEYIFPTAGSFNIGIGVIDGNDTARSSQLVVRNADVKPVPEPLTIMGSLTAIGMGVRLRQRLRQRLEKKA
ncbi:MAG: PEP-CTERM sorting domain-containing protein [Scytonema sp. PMC 1069.18]|nr:PEP-CTERM sorting domain-containing protein [Scytonema sp. PMC 1069.18]MEC4886906.1 PEP-CTERM sorting domain-containing protein [Scytonema sp. PMC 1070.18]